MDKDIIITITISEDEYKEWDGDMERIKKELLMDTRQAFESMGVHHCTIEINEPSI